MMDRRHFLKNNGFVIGGFFISTYSIATLSSCKKALSHEEYKILSYNEAKLISDFGDRIIPRTDTPGAKDVNIDKRIDEILKNDYPFSFATKVKRKLTDVNDLCINTFNKDFVLCSDIEQDQLIKFLSEEAKIPRLDDPHIYTIMKGFTVLAYFTSKEVCTNVLKNPMKVHKFRGCVPYDKIGGIWS